MYNFRKRIEEELDQILFLTRRTEQQLKRFNDGYLTRKRRKKKDTYYEIDEAGNRIGKPMHEDHPRVEEIKRKKFLDKQLSALKKDQKLLQYLQRYYNEYSLAVINAKLPQVYRVSVEDVEERKVDAGSHYAVESKLARHIPITKGHKTITGVSVRSIAEIAIFNLLVYYGVPFEYEKPLRLRFGESEKILYPDFTIYTPNGSKFYWEHVGMFGREDYKEDFLNKLEIYYENDIVLGGNLIVTFSNKNSAVDTEVFGKIIKAFLL